MTQATAAPPQEDIASGVDAEIYTANQRKPIGMRHLIVAAGCIAYTSFHILVMNLYPLEPWTYRLIHVSGGLALGYMLFSASSFGAGAPLAGAAAGGVVPGGSGESGAHGAHRMPLAGTVVTGLAGVLLAVAALQLLYAVATGDLIDVASRPAKDKYLYTFGYPLFGGAVLALLASWFWPNPSRYRFAVSDVLLALASVLVGAYIIAHADFLRVRAQVMPHVTDMWTSITGIILILELTRRLAGLALVIIVAVFLAYSFGGPYLPGFLYHRGYAPERLFSTIYTDIGILGPTTAISSTYIILFVAFAAFLQASRVGEYFVNFAFAAAGSARGGPAKVAVFGSGLMGTINGTSAGNVVSTGSLTIPLMKRVGYKPQTAAAVEAAASSGGQILPPIMGAGAFIMAEITGIPYTDIVIAAIIPAVLYFASVYFMVDIAAVKYGMKGLPRDQLPSMRRMARQAFLFIPIFILIGFLFAGYSVIRAGTMAMAAAAVVSWLTPYKMGPRAILYALEIAAKMTLQLVAVCAAAGIIVGVIAITGVGTRFSAVLLGLADQSQLIALFFAMVVAIVLGMGMPTTAAYAVAASVIAPGLIQLGIAPLTAHFFIFYFAVMSAITPPVALAAYAGAAIAQSDPMKTSVESFRIGLAAFVVPFMFFYSPALMMQGSYLDVAHVFITACLGIYLLSSAVQGWYFGRLNWVLRAVLLAASLSMIAGGWLSDAIGAFTAVLLWAIQTKRLTPGGAAHGLD